MHERSYIIASAAALAAFMFCASAFGQAAPPAPPGSEAPPEKTSNLKAYKFRPNLYWGAGLGLTFMPKPKTMCPTSETCIGSPAGFGFEFHMGARPHYLVAVDLMYDAFFFSEEKEAYNQATLQTIHAALRIYFLAGATIEVFGLVGGGVNFFGDKYNVQTTGGGFRMGVGAEWVPTPAFSIGLMALYKGAFFPSHKADYDSTLNVGSELLHTIDIMLNVAFRYVLVK